MNERTPPGSISAVLFSVLLVTTAVTWALPDGDGDFHADVIEEASMTMKMPPAVAVRTNRTAASPSRVVEPTTALSGPFATRKESAEEAAADRFTDGAEFATGEAGFALQVKDEVIPYRIFGLFVMPEEEVELDAVFTDGVGSGRLRAEHGSVMQTGPERWIWTAPAEPGSYAMTVADSASGDEIHLNVFVKTPFDHGTESINGYRIGQYESKPLRGSRAYVRPDGFVEVTRENRDTLVSPHFTLGQFLCKQQPGTWPKYVVVQERLLLKLEMILAQVNEMGHPANTLNVMSGFRTPWYNESIGNRTKYSQHLYGSAADVYVDIDDDAWMDDLTGDDEVTRGDAVRMANIIESMKDEVWYRPFIGGLGIYSPASHRGPFIHVDVRGSLARW